MCGGAVAGYEHAVVDKGAYIAPCTGILDEQAYLPKTEGMNAVSYSFRFPGTTGINEVKTENGEVKTVYDLAGRKVEAIAAPGIYIIDGKKVLVK